MRTAHLSTLPLIAQAVFIFERGQTDRQTQLLAASLLSSERKRLMLRNIRLDHLSVGLSVRKVYCGKMADWIRMPFGVMSGVNEGIHVSDGSPRASGKGVNFGVVYLHGPNGFNGVFCNRNVFDSCVRS